MKSKPITVIQPLASDMQAKPNLRLRISGSTAPPIAKRREREPLDPCIAAICDLLIKTGVSPHRIKVAVVRGVDIQRDRQAKLPMSAGQPPQTP